MIQELDAGCVLLRKGALPCHWLAVAEAAAAAAAEALNEFVVLTPVEARPHRFPLQEETRRLHFVQGRLRLSHFH